MSYKKTVSIIGLGYVGLPLLIEFSKFFKVVGYDIDKIKIKNLKKKYKNNKNILISNNINEIYETKFKIICVPTPVDKKNNPNLKLLFKASKLVSENMKNKDIIVYESTVYPGVTEDLCTPILEKFSNLKCITNVNNNGFFTGYSPERINPGDNKHTISNVIKIVSGNCKYSTTEISKLYNKIVKAGVYKAKNIKTAEAAKIIENIQRDVNIALINELGLLFNKMDIRIHNVLDAASTKWNFINFKPGLVGGHCIGVDPYYLAHKAKQLNFKPTIIESGRKTNDSMSPKLAKIFLNNMTKKNVIKIKKVLILGFTFKENCEDIRNTKIIDMYKFLIKNNCNVNVCDPIANPSDVKKMYDIKLVNKIPNKKYDGIIIAVSHNDFKKLDINVYKKISKRNTVIFDIKNLYPERNYLKI